MEFDMYDPTPIDGGYFFDEYDGPRFWANVDFHGGTEYKADPLANAEGECWLWTRIHSGDRGYGKFRTNIRMPAHVGAYRDFGNKIPEGHDLDHLCRTPACVNPSHLEPVTRGDNVRRGLVGNRTHCPNGHPYSENDTVAAHGRHRCRICYLETKRRNYRRAKAKQAA